jgi:hypothetical protein
MHRFTFAQLEPLVAIVSMEMLPVLGPMVRHDVAAQTAYTWLLFVWSIENKK